MSNIADIYSLTPAQEGIFFQSKLNPKGKSYHLQFLLSVTNKIEAEIFGQVLKLLALRHDVLRSAFAVSKSTGAIKQIILENRYSEFTEINLETEYGDEKLKEIAEKDADRPFDLEKDSLFRAVLISFCDAQYLLVSVHHLIIDGWSVAVLAKDIERFYKELSSGADFEGLKQKISEEKAAAASFGTYTEWLKTQSSDEAIAYWKNLFREYRGKPSPSSNYNGIYDSWFDSETIRIDEDSSKKINAFAVENNATANSVFETVFGIVLQRETNSNDVVFGKVVSGRNAKIPNIYGTVGPFINTVPVRIKTGENSDIKTLVQSVHKQSALSDRYGFMPLAEISRHTMLKHNSIDALFVFENYPFEYSGGTIGLKLIEYKDQTNFDLTVKVMPANTEYDVQIMFSPRYERSQMKNFLAEFRTVLEDMAENRLKNISGVKNEAETEAKSQTVDIITPEKDLEKAVCDKFSEILHFSPISIDADFFLSGGSSIDVITFLTDERFSKITAAEFIANPTPAGIAALLEKKNLNKYSCLQALYTPDPSKRALLLFPYAGGNAESYSELVKELSKTAPDLAIYFVPFLHSPEECRIAAEEVLDLVKYAEVSFYAHCIGDSVAIQMIDFIEEKEKKVKNIIVGANIPADKPLKYNWWHIVPDILLKKILTKAGSKIENLTHAQSAAILRMFRQDSDFFVDFFKSRTRKISSQISVIINKNDIFTQNWKKTVKNWSKYTTGDVTVHYIESNTHYFQAENADVLAKMIMEIIKG